MFRDDSCFEMKAWKSIFLSSKGRCRIFNPEKHEIITVIKIQTDELQKMRKFSSLTSLVWIKILFLYEAELEE